MKQKSLSNLEQQVMNIVWEHKKASVREVLVEISKKKKIAYTTVATILQRLENKELVSRHMITKTYVYSPKISKENYSKGLASSFIKRFVQSFGNVAMASFAESIDELPQEKRDYFLKLLDEHEKNK